MSEKVRLNKFISESGACSRREADKHIENGQVQINGRRAQIGDMVSPEHDKVLLSGMLIEARSKESFVLIAFNKPVGLVSTTEIGVKDSVVNYISFHERIFPIGRLDKDSQGLLILTNNGDIVNKILRAGNQHEKEYIVTVNKAITDEFIKKMGNGIPILGEITKKCFVAQEAPNVFRIILTQGLNRQIRRMCEYLGYEVVKLERIRIMGITLKGIPVGEWRLLDESEIEKIEQTLEGSHSTHKEAEEKVQKSKFNKPASKHGSPVSSPKNATKSKKEKQADYQNPKSRDLRNKQSGKTNKPYTRGSQRRSGSQTNKRHK